MSKASTIRTIAFSMAIPLLFATMLRLNNPDEVNTPSTNA